MQQTAGYMHPFVSSTNDVHGSNIRVFLFLLFLDVARKPSILWCI